jgi:hypothetical protein
MITVSQVEIKFGCRLRHFPQRLADRGMPRRSLAGTRKRRRPDVSVVFTGMLADRKGQQP